MRTSHDEYKLPDGRIVSLDQMTQPPHGAVIWNGYDYTRQYWVHNGTRDMRTLAELRIAMGK